MERSQIETQSQVWNGGEQVNQRVKRERKIEDRIRERLFASMKKEIRFQMKRKKQNLILN